MHFKKRFSRILPTPVSALALILAVSGHVFLLLSLQHFVVPSNKSPSKASVMAARLLSVKSNNVTLSEKLKKQTEQYQLIPGVTLSSATQSLEEIPFVSTLDTPYYYKSDELSQRPQVIDDLPVDFFLPDTVELPEPLIITLRISNTGGVDQVLIGDGQVDNDAIQMITNAFKSMTFIAARISDTSVPSEIRLEVWKNSEHPNEINQ